MRELITTAVCTNRSVKREGGGGGQEFVFSAHLFNIYSEMIVRNTKHHESLRVGGNNIKHLRYADDTVLIADSEDNCKNILTQPQSKVKTKDFY